MSNLHSDPDGVIGGAKRADKVGNLESVPSGVIGIAKHIDEVDNLESDPGGVGGGAKRAHEVGNLIRSQRKRFYENGHISGTVRPTPLQHPSNRSSLRARQEKRHRGSLTCPGNTGEPEAPVLGSNRHIELGPEAKK